MLVDVERSRITVTSTTARHIPSQEAAWFPALRRNISKRSLEMYNGPSAAVFIRDRAQRAPRGASVSSTALVRRKKILECAKIGRKYLNVQRWDWLFGTSRSHAAVFLSNPCVREGRCDGNPYNTTPSVQATVTDSQRFQCACTFRHTLGASMLLRTR